MIVRTPEENLDKVMSHFMRSTANEINKHSGRVNQVYGARYYKTLITNDHYFAHAYKYVYANPLKAGLIDRCERYRFSSLTFLVGNSIALFPVVYDHQLFGDLAGTLRWINQTPAQEDWDMVARGMKKSKFKLAKHNETNRPHRLENDML
jgi:hypothetical protein